MWEASPLGAQGYSAKGLAAHKGLVCAPQQRLRP